MKWRTGVVDGEESMWDAATGVHSTLGFVAVIIKSLCLLVEAFSLVTFLIGRHYR